MIKGYMVRVRVRVWVRARVRVRVRVSDDEEDLKDMIKGYKKTAEPSP